MKKKLICLCMVFAISASQILSVSASREAEIKAKKEETNTKLDNANKEINNLENKLTQLQGEIEKTNSDLVNVMVEIDVLEADIKTKEVEIEQTKVKLKESELERDKQYETMKKRIQYIYENGGKNAWVSMVFEAQSITGILNRAENTQQIYEADRESLDEYIAAVEQVKSLEAQLESERSELQEMQKSLENQKVQLQKTLDEKKATSDNFDGQLATIKAQADAYKNLIQQQNEQLRAIEAERQRQEAERQRQEAERQRQEAARRESERREAQRQEASRKPSNTSSNNNSTSSGSGSKDEGKKEDTTVTKVPSSSVGQAAVNYAMNFVGNPYVWGGTSLTNGADCSGFIQSVYKKFGISLPHSSSALRSVGRGVSYSEAQPGDIICYSGHVAIYIGGGAIVHASNEKDGIKVSPNAAYRTILAVRRVG